MGLSSTHRFDRLESSVFWRRHPYGPPTRQDPYVEFQASTAPRLDVYALAEPSDFETSCLSHLEISPPESWIHPSPRVILSELEHSRYSVSYRGSGSTRKARRDGQRTKECIEENKRGTAGSSPCGELWLSGYEGAVARASGRTSERQRYA